MRLLYPYEIHTGDHVAPLAVVPSFSRLYELTVGAVTPLYARACVRSPPMKWYAVSESPSPRGSDSSRNRFVSPSQSDMWKWQPFPVSCENGFGMNVAIIPRLLRQRVNHVAEEDRAVARDERVVVGEVLLELAVRVLVVVRVVAPSELVAVARDRRQEVVATRKAGHVVAGLLERVVRVGDLDRAVIALLDEEVLELEAHPELEAASPSPARARGGESCAGSTPTPRPRQ